ncbi:hypothetical protein CR969_00540 [Candidatus Saccharibacteria bacterium]|nr:MAG: hypothetical protein CR969_00540 [Candidatus Saccharibacteria bacterium]
MSKNNKMFILSSDREYITERITEIEQQIDDLGPEFYEAFNQSSETWHDNAPFEAVRDKQSNLSAERQYLRQILHDSTSSRPRSTKDQVEAGKNVTVENLSKSIVKYYFIAGDWTAHAGKKQPDGDATIISRRSPLGSAMLGLKVGNKFEFNGNEFLIKDVTTK